MAKINITVPTTKNRRVELAALKYIRKIIGKKLHLDLDANIEVKHSELTDTSSTVEVTLESFGFGRTFGLQMCLFVDRELGQLDAQVRIPTVSGSGQLIYGDTISFSGSINTPTSDISCICRVINLISAEYHRRNLVVVENQLKAALDNLDAVSSPK